MLVFQRLNAAMPTRAPPKHRSTYSPLTPEMLALLRSEAERTSAGSARLLKSARDKPRGLSAFTVENWMSGRVATVNPDHFAYFSALWADLPTKRRMPLTPEMAATLNAEMIRTGMGPLTVLKKAWACPPDLTYQVITAWACGAVTTVAVEPWEYLLARLGAMPDACGPIRSNHVRRKARAVIVEHDLAELRANRERTAIGGAVLLRNEPDKPPGLTPTMISSWLSGATATANPSHIAYVLARYRAWV